MSAGLYRYCPLKLSSPSYTINRGVLTIDVRPSNNLYYVRPSKVIKRALPHTSPFTYILNLGMASPIQLFRLAPCTRAYALRPSLMCCLKG
ncbi:hypothetical protein PC129_g18154 [Phytophthora cactorum]|uniref:Uncharacterized protein n=1 Tax=Phytophthora cactorum TaxID=29920 RepID=A0A8T1HFW5_9STRA|nr:hypothetical protein PC129_g18154 [Phytophthora cactorum]